MQLHEVVDLLFKAGLIFDDELKVAPKQCPVSANWSRAKYILFSSWYPNSSAPRFWFEPETHHKTLKSTYRVLQEAVERAGDESGAYRTYLVDKSGQVFEPKIEAISLKPLKFEWTP